MRRPILAITLLFALGACGQATDLYDFDGDGSLDAVDCAPSDGLIHPGADDAVGDGIDNNCDGVDGVDGDGDGFASMATGGLDCNDGESAVFPGALEVPDDGIDNDCEGGDLQCDGDGDGFVASICEGTEDCDDTNPNVYPGANEVCDGIAREERRR